MVNLRGVIMKYLLILSVIVNILLILKIVVMRSSVRSLQADFAERVSLDTNSLIGVDSRDRYIRKLVSTINDTLVSLRSSYHQ